MDVFVGGEVVLYEAGGREGEGVDVIKSFIS